MKFINSTFISYVQALNKELKRSGPLFDGRYKHVLVDREEYILHLCRYIHLNSVKAGLVSKPEDWPFSNYLEWINRQSGTLKDETFIKERFPISGEYEEFVNECQLGEETRLLIGDYLLDWNN
jgi:putative transposase